MFVYKANIKKEQFEKQIQNQYAIMHHVLKAIYSLTLYRNEAHYCCLTRLCTELSEWIYF